VSCHGCPHPPHAGQCPSCLCRVGSPPGASGVTATSAENSRWVAPLPDHEKPVDPYAPKCVGCGRYHGSVNLELRCLRDTIRRLRGAS
jgi:hypothetical protein